MNDKWLWVTGYSAGGQEVLLAQIGHRNDHFIFKLDEHNQVQDSNYGEFRAIQQQGASIRFFSIPDPF